MAMTGCYAAPAFNALCGLGAALTIEVRLALSSVVSYVMFCQYGSVALG
jgi:hypothetical protein